VRLFILPCLGATLRSVPTMAIKVPIGRSAQERGRCRRRVIAAMTDPCESRAGISLRMVRHSATAVCVAWRMVRRCAWKASRSALD
jgi:hypothetical protein